MTDKEINDFWTRIDTIRGKKTLKEISENTGISLATIKTTKSLGRVPNLSNARKIAQCLGCSLDYLLTEQISDTDYTVAEKELIANYRAAPLHYRIAAETILRENAEHSRIPKNENSDIESAH